MVTCKINYRFKKSAIAGLRRVSEFRNSEAGGYEFYPLIRERKNADEGLRLDILVEELIFCELKVVDKGY